MVVAQHFSQFPVFAFQNPEVGKSCGTGPKIFLVLLSDVKVVNACLDGSIDFARCIKRKHFQTLGSDFSDRFLVRGTTDIVCGIFQEFSFVLESALVVVKAQVFCYLIFQVV